MYHVNIHDVCIYIYRYTPICIYIYICIWYTQVYTCMYVLYVYTHNCRSKNPRRDCPVLRPPGFQHKTSREFFLSLWKSYCMMYVFPCFIIYVFCFVWIGKVFARQVWGFPVNHFQQWTPSLVHPQEPEDSAPVAKHELQHRWCGVVEWFSWRQVWFELWPKLPGVCGCTNAQDRKRQGFFPLHELFHREVTVRQDKAWGESQREVHSFDTAEESLRFSPLQLSSKKYWAEPPKFDGAAFRHQLFYEMAMAEGYISGKSSWISKIAMVSTLWHRNWIQLLNFQCFLAGLLVYVSLFLSTFEVGKCRLFAVQAGRQASGILAWVQGVEQQAAGGKRSTCFVQLRCCARLGGGYPVILWIHGPWKIWKQATGIWRWTIWGYHLVI